MIIAVTVYAFIAVLMALIGVGVWLDSHQECDKIGARMFFLAPVWPLAVVGVILYFFVTQVGSMWRDAGWGKK